MFLVRDQFLHIDAEAILKTYISQREVPDRIVWVNSSNGIYNAKYAYQYWYNANFGHDVVPQSTGWEKNWHLQLSHKIKVFAWRFCRNVVPIRKRLISIGVRLPIKCPMSVLHIEHMMHLFFDCMLPEVVGPRLVCITIGAMWNLLLVGFFKN